MITFVGAGPGAEDLITVRGQNLLREADIVVYAGSLVNPGLLSLCREDCEIYNSAKMTLEEVLDVMSAGEKSGKKVVRLHTGDPCLYGAIREQMDELEKMGIPYEVCPGVSSFCGAGGGAGSGVYAARSFPVCGDHQNGRAHACPGERIHQKLCRPSGDNGDLLKYRNVKRTFRRADQRGI